MTDLLAVDDLIVRYGGVTALRGASLRVAKGEVVVLLGANGAGKSTMLRALSAIVPKAGGRVRLDGADVTRAGAAEMVRRGFVHVPEGREIFARMTVRENLLMGGFRFGAPKPETFARVLELFPRLKERFDQRGGSLSGGEQQMLAIARGLLAEPALIALDEPSLGLAPKIVAQVFAVLRALRESGITILLAEQNARQALAFADRAYVLVNGAIKAEGAAAELRDSPAIIDAYLGGQHFTKETTHG